MVSFPWDSLLILVWGLTDQPHKPPSLNHTSITSLFKLPACGWGASAGGPRGTCSGLSLPAMPRRPPITATTAVSGIYELPSCKACHSPVLYPALVFGTSHNPHLEEAFSPLLHQTHETLPPPGRSR